MYRYLINIHTNYNIKGAFKSSIIYDFIHLVINCIHILILVIYTALQNHKNLYNNKIVYCYVRVSAWQKVK